MAKMRKFLFFRKHCTFWQIIDGIFTNQKIGVQHYQ
jgi:hypothetical protein